MKIDEYNLCAEDIKAIMVLIRVIFDEKMHESSIIANIPSDEKFNKILYSLSKYISKKKFLMNEEIKEIYADISCRVALILLKQLRYNECVLLCDAGINFCGEHRIVASISLFFQIKAACMFGEGYMCQGLQFLERSRENIVLYDLNSKSTTLTTFAANETRGTIIDLETKGIRKESI